MDCQACVEEIPNDSIFCPECGARQDLSRAGSRSFGVVSPEAVTAQRDEQNAPAPQAQPMDVDTLNILASQMGGGAPADQQTDSTGVDIASAFEEQNISTTNDIVDRLNVVERKQKTDARSEWLDMNVDTAEDVLAQVNAELPSHLRKDEQSASSAARFLEEALGDGDEQGDGDSPPIGLLRRMAEVAVRRVARKRGVAVESPQVALEDDLIRVNVTYVDDGRVLDTPSDLSNAFEHAITTEVALKGLDLSVAIVLYSSKDGEVDHVWGDVPESDEPEDDEEKFACEACGHYPVMESDPACPNCGAQFEDDSEEDEAPAPRGGPPGGPRRGGPPGGPSRGGPPSRGGGSPGRGGPGGPPGGGGGGPPRGGPPSRGGGPSGPSRGGPPGRGGGSPGGPPRGGGSGGPPSGGGPPGRGGPPKGGPGGPPKGGPGGPPRGKPGGPRRRSPPR